MSPVIEKLAADYPLLRLNPDTDSREAYRAVVLRGEDPETGSFSHYAGDPGDSDETMDTPIGPVRVITLGNRRDFGLVLRGLMAARKGPGAEIPETQGAAMLTVPNWPRIRAHLAAFPEEERDAEFSRYISDKTNYLDFLVVLSRGPYSHISAGAAGHTEEEWLVLSDTIRRYHELTHAICRRLYPDKIDLVRDELVADAVGLYAAYGRFDPEKVKLFLGIRDGRYEGGRLAIYTPEPEKQAGPVCAELERIRACVDALPGAAPFDLIPPLMEGDAS